MKNIKLKLTRMLSVMLIVAMAFVVTSCGSEEKQPEGNTTSQVIEEVAVLKDGDEVGEGETQFKLVIANGVDVINVTVNTDEKILADALVANNIVSGTEGEYGLMVDTVNGVKVDYDKDGAYWAFYIDGEFAQTGVSSTEIVAGAEYKFEVTKA